MSSELQSPHNRPTRIAEQVRPYGFNKWPSRVKNATILASGGLMEGERLIENPEKNNNRIFKTSITHVQLLFLRNSLIRKLDVGNRIIDLWVKRKNEDGTYEVFLEVSAGGEPDFRDLFGALNVDLQICENPETNRLVFGDKVFIDEDNLSWNSYAFHENEELISVEIDIDTVDATSTGANVEHNSTKGIIVRFLVEDILKLLDDNPGLPLEDIFEIFSLYKNRSVKYDFSGKYLCIIFTSENCAADAIAYARSIVKQTKLAGFVSDGEFTGDFYTNSIIVDDLSPLKKSNGVYIERNVSERLRSPSKGRLAQQVRLTVTETEEPYLKVDGFRIEHNLDHLMPIVGKGQIEAYGQLIELVRDSQTRFIGLKGTAGIGKTNFIMNLIKDFPDTVMAVAMFRDANTTSAADGLKDMFVRIFTDLIRNYSDLISETEKRDIENFLKGNNITQLKDLRDQKKLARIFQCLESAYMVIIESGKQVLMVLDDIHFLDEYSRQKLKYLKDRFLERLDVKSFKMIFVTRPENETIKSLLGTDVFGGAKFICPPVLNFFDENGNLCKYEAETFIANFFKKKIGLELNSINLDSFTELLRYSRGVPLRAEELLRMGVENGNVFVTEHGELICVNNGTSFFVDEDSEQGTILRRRIENQNLSDIQKEILYIISVLGIEKFTALDIYCFEVYDISELENVLRPLLNLGFVAYNSDHTVSVVDPLLGTIVPAMFAPVERRNIAKKMLGYVEEDRLNNDPIVRTVLLREILGTVSSPDDLSEEDCTRLERDINALLKEAFEQNQLHLIVRLSMEIELLAKALNTMKIPDSVSILSPQAIIINRLAAALINARFYAAVHLGNRKEADTIIYEFKDSIFGKYEMTMAKGDASSLANHPFESIQKDFLKTMIFHHYLNQDRTGDYLKIFTELIKLYFEKYGVDPYLLSYYLFRLGKTVGSSALYQDIKKYAEDNNLSIEEGTKSHDLLIRILSLKTDDKSLANDRARNEAFRLSCRVRYVKEVSWLQENCPFDDRSTIYLGKLVDRKKKFSRLERVTLINKLRNLYLNNPEKITDATVFDLLEQVYQEHALLAEGSAQYSRVADEMFSELCVPLKNLGKTGQLALNLGLLARIRWAEVMTNSKILKRDIRHMDKILEVYGYARKVVKLLPKALPNKRIFYQDLMAFFGTILDDIDLAGLLSEPNAEICDRNKNLINGLLELIRDIVEFINNDGLEINNDTRVYEWCEVVRLIEFLNKVKSLSDKHSLVDFSLRDFEELKNALESVSDKVKGSSNLIDAQTKANEFKDPIGRSKLKLLTRLSGVMPRTNQFPSV